MPQSPNANHSPSSAPQRPKGILKNSNSFTLGSPPIGSNPSPTDTTAVFSPPATDPNADPLSLDGNTNGARRPSAPTDQMTDKEITMQNTLANAGPRRNSSNTRRSSAGGSRRASATAMDVDDDNGPRLQWDEANLFKTEQERGSTMKITEPKTPYAKQYDPMEDEEEIRAIDARDLMVDELDKAKSESASGGAAPVKRSREEIPDLDLGEPEEDVSAQDGMDNGEKRVVVDDSVVGNATEEGESRSGEAQKKHQQFEEKRKRHYEMRDVKGLLGHPEDLDQLDEDEGTKGNPPPMPKMPTNQ